MESLHWGLHGEFCFGLADEVFKVLAFKKLHSYKVKRVAAKTRKPRLNK